MFSTAQDPGQICWIDLAASDSEQARRYYERLFGWNAREQKCNGGVFTRLELAGRDVGSLYQLQKKHVGRGVPSHWTPYVRVTDTDDAVRYAERLGGSILARPFTIAGLARVAVVVDPVGAPVGLWQPAAGTNG
jgi:predicted enzyme related to lactoylglutathione lyase